MKPLLEDVFHLHIHLTYEWFCVQVKCRQTLLCIVKRVFVMFFYDIFNDSFIATDIFDDFTDMQAHL